MSALEGRAADIRAAVGEATPGPLRDLFTAIICDGCGATLTAATPSELARLTSDWAIGSALGLPDFCWACRH